MDPLKITLPQVIQTLSDYPMDTLQEVEKITFHAGVALMQEGWGGQLLDHFLFIDDNSKRTLSFLGEAGLILNAKGETEAQAKDGRYPSITGAFTLETGTVCRVNLSHCDQALLTDLRGRFMSITQKEALDTATPHAAPRIVSPRI